jgi:hypothetical protein
MFYVTGFKNSDGTADCLSVGIGKQGSHLIKECMCVDSVSGHEIEEFLRERVTDPRIKWDSEYSQFCIWVDSIEEGEVIANQLRDALITAYENTLIYKEVKVSLC